MRRLVHGWQSSTDHRYDIYYIGEWWVLASQTSSTKSAVYFGVWFHLLATEQLIEDKNKGSAAVTLCLTKCPSTVRGAVCSHSDFQTVSLHRESCWLSTSTMMTVFSATSSAPKWCALTLSSLTWARTSSHGHGMSLKKLTNPGTMLVNQHAWSAIEDVSYSKNPIV